MESERDSMRELERRVELKTLEYEADRNGIRDDVVSRFVASLAYVPLDCLFGSIVFVACDTSWLNGDRNVTWVELLVLFAVVSLSLSGHFWYESRPDPHAETKMGKARYELHELKAELEEARSSHRRAERLRVTEQRTHHGGSISVVDEASGRLEMSERSEGAVELIEETASNGS